jgi:hypothetical protein
MVQILSGHIIYLLLAIYCQEQYGEPVSIHRVRQLRNQLRNEVTQQAAEKAAMQNRKRKKRALNNFKNPIQFPNRTSLSKRRLLELWLEPGTSN